MGACMRGIGCAEVVPTNSRTAAAVGTVSASSSKLSAVSTSDSAVLAARCSTRTYSRSALAGVCLSKRSLGWRMCVVGKWSSWLGLAAKAAGLRTSDQM